MKKETTKWDTMPAEKEEEFEILNMPSAKCPMCQGAMRKLSAGTRGGAFGNGNFFGAFSKSFGCRSCGFLM